MKSLENLPTPEAIMDRPQLAVLVALEVTLVSTLRALLAAHPMLLDDTYPRTILEQDFWAERVVYLGGELGTALEKYKRASKPSTHFQDSCDRPF